jgi:hypothetical protein
MKLTIEQSDAIGHADGNLQLIACAGSGKTEVVAQHITRLLKPDGEGGMGLKPANIVAFTFTEKAAATALAAELFTDTPGIPWIATSPGHAGRKHGPSEHFQISSYGTAVAFICNLMWRIASMEKAAARTPRATRSRRTGRRGFIRT